MSKLKKLVINYLELEKKLEFNKDYIDSNLINNDTLISEIEIGKEYFTPDFDGHFCNYYLIKKLSENALFYVPLWNLEVGGKEYYSGEVETDILYEFVVDIDKNTLNYLIDGIDTEWYLNKLNSDEELSITDYWTYACSDAVISNPDTIEDEFSEIIENSCYVIYLSK